MLQTFSNCASQHYTLKPVEELSSLTVIARRHDYMRKASQQLEEKPT